MQTCYLIRWELKESSGNFPYGASLHISEEDMLNWKKKNEDKMFFLGSIKCIIDEYLFKKLSERKNLKLNEIEFKNLLSMEEIFYF